MIDNFWFYKNLWKNNLEGFQPLTLLKTEIFISDLFLYLFFKDSPYFLWKSISRNTLKWLLPLYSETHSSLSLSLSETNFFINFALSTKILSPLQKILVRTLQARNII